MLGDEETGEPSASAPPINGDIVVFENGGTLENPHNLGSCQRESPYIIPMFVRICVGDDAGAVVASVGEEGQQLTEVAVLRGDLILGYQMSRDDVDFLTECDDYTADCGAAAYEILDEGVFSEQGIFVIHSYQTSAGLPGSGKAGHCLDTVPQVAFGSSNVMPATLCYLVATAPGLNDRHEFGRSQTPPVELNIIIVSRRRQLKSIRAKRDVPNANEAAEEAGMATLAVRLSDGLKSKAADVAEYCGLDLGSVTRAFCSQMVREHSIPLNLGSHEPNAESLEAIAETDSMIASGDYDTYGDAASLLAAAGA